jgi:hypothetical protein
MNDAQIIWNSKNNLKVQHRTGGKTTTLQIVWRGKQLEIHISIETEYPKRTVYTSSVFRCGFDIADMIAEACMREATTGNTSGSPGITSKAMEHSHE